MVKWIAWKNAWRTWENRKEDADAELEGLLRKLRRTVRLPASLGWFVVDPMPSVPMLHFWEAGPDGDEDDRPPRWAAEPLREILTEYVRGERHELPSESEMVAIAEENYQRREGGSSPYLPATLWTSSMLRGS